ncbi:MAG: serine hydrolase [Anaerolineae bacterium]|nr:serine hydrolase [Anaerolineae bacterium]
MTRATPLQRSTPEAEGIPSSAVLDFIRAVEEPHPHPLDAVQGFMLLRHGRVAAEGWWAPYGPHSPHALHSLSKSFTSTAIGLAVAEGLLTVEDPVLQFFPDAAPANPGENLKAMRVRHLLSMNTGHKEDTTGEVFQDRHLQNLFGVEAHHKANTVGHVFGNEDDNWPRVFLSLPVEYRPGAWFVYNTAATYMLSAILTQLTGESLLDYLRPRLFDPLGIENPAWDTDPRGVNLGGTGLSITTEDIACFGQLYLQQGVWEGRRILPATWVAAATQAISDTRNTRTKPDWAVGYGYQFWRCQRNCYRGDGAFGQYCLVMPEQDAVLAIVGGVRDMQAVLDKVWEHLLPAMQPEALPNDPPVYGALRDRLASLSLPLPQGQPASSAAARGQGKMYRLDPNELQLESLRLDFSGAHQTLVLGNERGEHPIQVGYADWLHGTTNVRGYGAEPVAAGGAWTAEDICEVRICYYKSAFCSTFRFHFTGSRLRLDVTPNVFRGSTATRTLTGHVVD